MFLKELELFDIYLILAIPSVRVDPKLSVGILKNQINFNIDRMNGLYKNIKEVLNNEKVSFFLFFTYIFLV